jgi:transcriptional regulator with XRE-family HTH domain
MPDSFAKWVRKVRFAKGQSLVEASTEIGVSRIQYIAWEQGRAWPQVPRIFKLADWAGVKVDDLKSLFV